MRMVVDADQLGLAVLGAAQRLAVYGQHLAALCHRAAAGRRGLAAGQHPTGPASSAATSNLPSSRRNVLACGGRPHTATVWPATAAQSAIAA